MTELIVREQTALSTVVTEDQVELIKRTVAAGATDAELQLYLYDCQRHGVHPLDRLLHFTKRSNKYTPITSIDLFRSRAADTGELAGIDDAVFVGEPKAPGFQASVTVYRLVGGLRCGFTATARWAEYKPDRDDFMWQKMPHGQLGKCAEALALRKAFPRQLSGTYVREEMEQAGPNEQPQRDPAVTVAAVAFFDKHETTLKGRTYALAKRFLNVDLPMPTTVEGWQRIDDAVDAKIQALAEQRTKRKNGNAFEEDYEAIDAEMKAAA